MSGAGDSKEPLALRVMRLSENRFASSVWSPVESLVQGSIATEGLVKAPEVLAMEWEPAATEELALQLPIQQGRVFAGETFKAYVDLVNLSAETILTNVSVLVELSGPSMSSSTTLFDNRLSPVKSFAPAEVIDAVVSHVIQSVGSFILSCVITYQTPPGSSQTYGDVAVKTIKKTYKFNASAPLKISHRVEWLNEPVLVECSLENATGSLMHIEQANIICPQSIKATYLSPISQKIPGIANLRSHDVFHLLYKLEPVALGTAEDMKKLSSLGNISVDWRLPTGGPGHLENYSLDVDVKVSKHVEVRVANCPVSVEVEVPFTVQFECINRTNEMLDLVLEFIKEIMAPIYVAVWPVVRWTHTDGSSIEAAAHSVRAILISSDPAVMRHQSKDVEIGQNFVDFTYLWKLRTESVQFRITLIHDTNKPIVLCTAEWPFCPYNAPNSDFILPDAPISTWLVNLKGDYVWSHRLWGSDSDDILYSCRLGDTFSTSSVTIDQTAAVLEHIQLTRKILYLGSFMLPHGKIYLCPAPRTRFCIDLNCPVDFFSSRKSRKDCSRYRVSVNYRFGKTLELAGLWHRVAKGCTWITPDLIDTLDWFRIKETPDWLWRVSDYKPSADIVDDTMSEVSLTHDMACESDVAAQVKKLLSLADLKTLKTIREMKDKHILRRSRPCKIMCDSTSRLDTPSSLPPIQMYSFELWDVESSTLAAAVFTYVIGRVACDMTCLTIRRDRTRCGFLLSKYVADILRRAGIKLWYWGMELPYMKEFADKYGGLRLSSEVFYNKWFSLALGCYRCMNNYTPGAFHRMPCPQRQDTPRTQNLPSRLLCDSCIQKGSWKEEETQSIAAIMGGPYAKIKPLDFFPQKNIDANMLRKALKTYATTLVE